MTSVARTLDLRLIIELDGERYHTDRNTFRADRRRQNELIQEGYRILRFTAWDVFAARDYLIAQVVAARRTLPSPFFGAIASPAIAHLPKKE